MIERISVALAIAVHLAIILLLGRLNFEVNEGEQQINAMDIKFRGVQSGIDSPLDAFPEPSPALQVSEPAAMPLAENADSVGPVPVPPSAAEVSPKSKPEVKSSPEAPMPAVPASVPQAKPVAQASAEPISVADPVPRPITPLALAPTAASAAISQPVPAPVQAPVPADTRRAVSDIANTLRQSGERTRPRLNAAMLSGLRNTVGGDQKSSQLNVAVIGSAIARAAPRGLPGLTRVQKIDLAQKVREQVMPCWKPPVSDAPMEATVRLRFRLDQNGGVVGLPTQSAASNPAAPNAAYLNLLANSGRRAILKCAPLKLPPDLYEAWADVEVEFDPRDLR